MGSYERQKDLVCKNISTKKTKTLLSKNGEVKQKKQTVRNKFFFELNGVNEQVCKRFSAR